MHPDYRIETSPHYVPFGGRRSKAIQAYGVHVPTGEVVGSLQAWPEQYPGEDDTRPTPGTDAEPQGKLFRPQAPAKIDNLAVDEDHRGLGLATGMAAVLGNAVGKPQIPTALSPDSAGFLDAHGVPNGGANWGHAQERIEDAARWGEHLDPEDAEDAARRSRNYFAEGQIDQATASRDLALRDWSAPLRDDTHRATRPSWLASPQFDAAPTSKAEIPGQQSLF